jgi:hypothetical protein
MTAESARQWIYVSGDVDIDRPADDNNAIRAVNAVVRARARELWEINGGPAGRDLEFWLQAERDYKKQKSERLIRLIVRHRSVRMYGLALRPIEGQGRQPRSGMPRSELGSLGDAQPPQPSQ